VPDNEESILSVHDLRQPLTAILSAATALRADPSLDADTQETLLNIVVENAARLSRMLETADSSHTVRPPDRP
jgi:K+-sensing histidine kinase KdpD